MEQMLTALRKGGYLVSVRGPKGGYQLTRSPDLITVAQVEDCLEGVVRAEGQGDRGHAEFRALDGLAEQARDRLRQPTPMFYI